jgi:hypothetical protein
MGPRAHNQLTYNGLRAKRRCGLLIGHPTGHETHPQRRERADRSSQRHRCFTQCVATGCCALASGALPSGGAAEPCSPQPLEQEEDALAERARRRPQTHLQ